MDIRAIHEQNRRDQVAKQRHDENQVANIQLQETVVKSFSSLVDYLDKKVSRTEVVNQLRSIGTPDAFKVAASVDSLHETIKSKPEVDLSEIVTLLKDSLEQVKLIPKEKLELPEAPEQTDYTDSFKRLEDTISSVKSAIEAQKTVVEAPVVNIPETVVNVPETDLKPLQKGLEQVEKSVKALVFPKTDTSKIEKEQVKQTKLLKEIRDKPVSGGGGGGSSWPAVNESGIVQPLRLNSGNELIVAPQDGLATEIQQVAQGEVLEEIEHAVQSIASAKGVAGDIRVTILSGTVTTVSTLSNQSSMGGWTASSLVPATSNTTAVLSNINNVGV